jgi:acyl-CoA reductase-like NAD-dependent aldehyde dehydrogenase
VPGRAESETLAAELIPLADACRFVAQNARSVLRPERVSGQGRPRWSTAATIEVHREPWGRVLIVAPANYPLFLAGVPVLHALAAGNTVQLKSAPGFAELSGALRDLWLRAGLPESALTLLDESVGAVYDALEDGVDHVVFTGSAVAGRRVLQAAARSLTPATLELSGCDAVFLLESADVQLAARSLVFGLRLNNGATCLAPRRIFVPKGLMPPFTAAVQKLAETSPPLSLSGPAADQFAKRVEAALAAGARPVCGEWGDTCQPVLLEGLDSAHPLTQADLMAPMAFVFGTGTGSGEEALAWNARCRFALGASVFGDPSAARAFAARVPAGCVTINDLVAPAADPRMPFSGWNQSGFGVTRGAEGLRAMTRLKAISLPTTSWRPHLEPSVDAESLHDVLHWTHGESWAERWRALGRLIARSFRRPAVTTLRPPPPVLEPRP